MLKNALLTLLACAALWFPCQGYAAGRHVPALDHVFLIMMENHDYDEPGRAPAILKNAADAPYINAMARKYDLATNYLAVGHPSLTNYLELVGGSNFGVNRDLYPHWGSPENTRHRYGFIPTRGTDVASASFAYARMCCDDRLGHTVPGGATFAGETIADQLERAGRTWKTYQESLPVRGGYGVDTSDGRKINQGVALYAVKHNPFEYFRATQGSQAIVGYTSNLHRRTVGGALAKDLAAGTVADFSFIAPNQCHDMHGTPVCAEAHNLIRDGDREVQALVTAVTGSAVWKSGRNAIIVMWDENDFSATGNNRVPVIIRTSYQSRGMHSARAYNHFSLLKTLEQAFGLGYLNHAGDPDIHAMSDLFAPR